MSDIKILHTILSILIDNNIQAFNPQSRTLNRTTGKTENFFNISVSKTDYVKTIELLAAYEVLPTAIQNDPKSIRFAINLKEPELSFSDKIGQALYEHDLKSQ